jgi:hypothetical protein
MNPCPVRCARYWDLWRRWNDAVKPETIKHWADMFFNHLEKCPMCSAWVKQAETIQDSRWAMEREREMKG